MELAGKTAIITGGASGIGEAIANKFATEGAKVFVLDLHASKDAAEDNQLTVIECDISHPDRVDQAVQKIAGSGNIDILVNNAGVAHIGNIEKTSEKDMQRLFDINIKGIYNCCRSCIPFMKAKGGVILNMGSIAATVGLPDRFAYSMTKGAVVAMTYSIARDYIKDGIRCNSISPARVHTPFVDGFLKENYPGKEKEMYQKLANTQPIGRMGTPEEIADLACYLSSDKAAFITGTDYPIDGGFLRLNT